MLVSSVHKANMKLISMHGMSVLCCENHTLKWWLHSELSLQVHTKEAG